MHGTLALCLWLKINISSFILLIFEEDNDV